MGLLFNDQTGELELELESGVPLAGTASGSLLVTSGYNDQFTESSKCADSTSTMELIKLDSQAIQLASGVSSLYESKITGLVPRLPFDVGRDLILQVDLEIEPASPLRNVDVPRILPGGFMQLPLDEYIDEIELPTVAKLTVDNSRATRNPGATALFSLSIDGTGSYEISALGVNNEWSRFSPGPYKSDDAIKFAVDIPDDALSTDYADLVIKAVDQETGELLLSRIFVEVDDTDRHPDDAPLSGDVTWKSIRIVSHDSPPGQGLEAEVECLRGTRKHA
jgi:hypothetical protein